MELRKLNELRNQYPNGAESYQKQGGDGGTILQGLYPKNKLKFKKREDIESVVNIVDGTFEFIVKFKPDDTLYASKTFIDKLTDSKENPYIQLNTLPIIIVNLGELDNYSKKESFAIPENYAEVKVTNTLDTKEDYLKYIDWITRSEEGRAPLISSRELGDWELETTEDLGFRFQDELDRLERERDVDVEDADNPIDESSQSGGSSTTLETEGETSEITLGGGSSNTNTNNTFSGGSSNNFRPFGTPGNTDGEIRFKGIGRKYRWNAGKQRWMRTLG